MLSGRRTFSGESAVEVMNSILKEDPPELGETDATISPALEKIVRRCLEKKPERRFQTASDLGFALEALSAPSGSRLETEALPAVVENVGASSDPYARIIQLEAERSLGDGELERLLRHKLAAVRYRAALAIGRIGDKRGTAALLKALEQETALKLRLITVFALGEMEDAQAAPALLNLLERKTEAKEARARAAEALGKIASVEANTAALGKEMVEKINLALIAQLPDPRLALLPGNKMLASLTITALMRVRQPSCVEPLTRQLKSRDAVVRAQAANALSRVRHPINAAAPALIELVTDRDINVRANSARALGLVKEAGAWERSGSDALNDARLALLNAIAKYKTPRAVNLVKSSLAYPDQRLRRRATELLRQMGVDGAEIPAEAAAAPHDQAYYARVRRLQDKIVTVTIYTSKGPIKVEMFAKDSPMTVDNFIELAAVNSSSAIRRSRIWMAATLSSGK